MKLRSLFLVLVAAGARRSRRPDPSLSAACGLRRPRSASADPTRQPLELASFWSGASWDGWHQGINYLLEAYGATELEYLNDGSGNYTSFRFDDDIFDLTKIGGITAWTQGMLGRRADGAFTYDSGTGRRSNSWDNPGQFALFRLVIPEATHYFLGIEDILLSRG